jgi:preprotein translocase subunit SecF
MKEQFQELYYKHYKKLFFIPLIIVILAFGVLVWNYSTTGDIMDKDVSLKGGTTATLYSSEHYDGLEEKLEEKFGEDFTVRDLKEFGSNTQIGTVIEVSNVNGDDLKIALGEITGLELNADNFSVEFIGGSLGESFYKQMAIALLLAYVFMGIVVFVAFRVPMPSFAVIFSAFGDMLCTLAVMDLIGMKLSTAGIAAILLLLGYSVDTDILLTTKLLRRGEGTLFTRLIDSMKTGLTMSATSFVALGIAYFLASSFVLKQMFLIILIGLLFDIIMTYAMNAGILIWYLKKKKVEQ